MRDRRGTSFRLFAASIAMAMLALAALTALSGCGGGGGVTEQPTRGLIIRGSVRDEAGKGVSGIRITILPNNVPIVSGADGSFTLNLGEVAVPPTTFTVDVGSRANEYYAVFSYGGRTIQGCPVNLPTPVDNLIEMGVIIVYSESAPPPPPTDICP